MHRTDWNDGSDTDGCDVVRVDCEPDESVTEAVLRGIEAINGVTGTEGDPLYEQVEFDALEKIVRHADRRDRPLSVRFPIDEHTVCVNGDGRIRIVGESHPLALGDQRERTGTEKS